MADTYKQGTLGSLWDGVPIGDDVDWVRARARAWRMLNVPPKNAIEAALRDWCALPAWYHRPNPHDVLSGTEFDPARHNPNTVT